ncbi:hypothetical protein ACIBXA_26160 [Micromonospora echinaurantiaca]|uniref:hypothetical protein n=1 Tax=Micromonospora echinaurantiaca TaxID=47857 RepID=UPI0026C537C5
MLGLLVLAVAAPWVGGWPPVLVTSLALLVLAAVVVGDLLGERSTRPALRGHPG